MAKHYSILRVQKLKTRQHLRGCYNHNDRIVNINNVDPSKSRDNVHYIDTNGKSYEFMLDEELAKLKAQGVPNKTIRSTAVLGTEVYMGFSYEANGSFDLDAWTKSSFEWLDKTFNPPNHEIHYVNAETGKEEVAKVQNIKHFVLHMDENNPHIHAFIIPIDDRGNLRYEYYHDQISPFYKIQNSYSEKMKEFGLSRGERFSAARHEDVKEYYNKLEQAVNAELPEPQKDERIFDYYKRANEAHQVAMVHHRDEIVKLKQEIVHVKSEATTNALNDQIKFKNAKDVTEVLSRGLKLDEPVTPDIADEIVRGYKNNSTLHKALENHPDRELAAQVAELNEAMINWQHLHELEMQLEEEREER